MDAIVFQLGTYVKFHLLQPTKRILTELSLQSVFTTQTPVPNGSHKCAKTTWPPTTKLSREWCWQFSAAVLYSADGKEMSFRSARARWFPARRVRRGGGCSSVLTPAPGHRGRVTGSAATWAGQRRRVPRPPPPAHGRTKTRRPPLFNNADDRKQYHTAPASCQKRPYLIADTAVH